MCSGLHNYQSLIDVNGLFKARPHKQNSAKTTVRTWPNGFIVFVNLVLWVFEHGFSPHQFYGVTTVGLKSANLGIF